MKIKIIGVSYLISYIRPHNLILLKSEHTLCVIFHGMHNRDKNIF